jgi:hypothetical protein
MSTQIQRRRGTTAEHSTFTGVEGELTVDTTKDTAVVHDGTTVGGHPLQKQYPPLGSAAAPTYTFTGDSNTGIYSPGADQVAVATNGTGRLFIDASGRVGIGATPWSGAQGLYLGSAGHIYGVGTNSVYYNTNAYFNSGWKYNGNSAAVQFEASGGQFIFNTAPANSSGAGAALTWSERLRITSAGLVGVGTSAPDGLLHVASASAGTVTANGNANELVVENSSTGGISILTPDANHGYLIFGSPSDNEGAIIRYRHTDGIYTIGTEAAGGSIQLRSGTGTTALTIDSSQRVGIGTTSPSTILDLTGNGNPTITFNDSSDGRSASINGDAGNLILTSDTAASRNVVFRTISGSESVRIDSSGRLGIGTSAPAQILHASTVTAGGTTSLLISNPNSALGAGAAIKLGVSPEDNTVAKFGIIHERNNFFGGGNTYFCTNYAADATEVSKSDAAITILGSSKNVGIGTTAPEELVHINALSSGALVDLLKIDNGGGAVGTEAGIVFECGTDRTARISSANTGSDLGALKFWTAGSVDTLSERARIDSSGRLLVGTSTARSNIARYGADYTPATQIQTNETSGWGTGLSLVNYSASGYAPVLTFGLSGSNTAGTNTLVASGDRMGVITFNGNDGTNFEEGARIEAQVDGTPGTNDMPGRLVFSTTADGASSPTERMRINSGGTLLLNGTAPIDSGVALSIQAADSSHAAEVKVRTNGRNAFEFRNSSNADVGSITVNAASTAYNTSSDYRLKENVTAVTDGIARLQQLKPSRFNFITDPARTVDGFLAHEVQTIVPEAITGEKDAVDDDGNPEYQGIDQSKLVPLLTAALQEAIAKIETLEGMVAVNNITIDEQQHQLSTLAARLTALESA